MTRKVPLIPLPVMRVPFSRVAMDMVDPLPVTTEGHKFILTEVDYGTKYPMAYPLKSTTSQDIAEALIDLFASVGFQEEITTDRGVNFCSKIFRERYNLPSAYHPETDSKVERYNATLKNGLQKFVQRFNGQ